VLGWIPMARDLLRHTLATLAYRSQKTIRGAPEGFAAYRISPTSRTPVEILAHMADLFDWAISLARGKAAWSPIPAASWDETAARYTEALRAFDAVLESDAPLGASEEKLFQGPIADALTHTGQLALLRRACGDPVRGENYFVARIGAGTLGADQPAAVREFE